MAELQLYLLGAPRVEVDGQPRPVERRKALALLAYLTLTPGPQRRDSLAALLWPGYDAATSRGNLRRTLSELTKSLDGAALAIERETIALPNDHRVWCDVMQFAALLDGCRGHGHPSTDVCPACRAPLARAAALYRDDLLAGFTLADSAEFDEWQTLQTSHLRRRAGEALARLVRCCLEDGDLDAALASAHRRLALDLLDEDAHRQLMQLYAWRGERSAALRQYDDCVQLLAAELGVPPQTATSDLRAAIAADRLPSRPEAPAAGRPAASTAPPVEAAPAGELRLVTVLVAGPSLPPGAEDIEPPPPGLAAALSAALTAAGATAQPHLDDGVIGVFGLEQLHEDDAERAVFAGLALREQAAALGAAIGVGLHSGRIYVVEGSERTPRLGPVVHVAARLADQAATGQILLSQATYALAQRGVRATATTPLTLPDAPRPLTVYAVERRRRRPRRLRGGDGLTAALVGRGEEMDKMAAALAALRQGRGNVLLLTGEAGVGKSRLVEELADLAIAVQAEPPVLWLEGRCLEMTQAVAYAPFSGLLQTHLAAATPDVPTGVQLTAWLDGLAGERVLSADQRGEMGLLLARLLAVHSGEAWQEALAAADPQQLQYRTFAVLRDLITALARRGPLVLALDDLHWADDLSLDLLGELLPVILDAALLILAAYRDVPDHRSQQLARLAAQRCAGRVRQIQLAALPPEQTAALATALLGGELDAPALAAIQTRAQGNPFFVEEIVRDQVETGALVRDGDHWRSRGDAASDSVPATIQSVILSRVDRLPPGPRRLLRRAAVIGPRFERDLLAEVTSEADLPATLATLEERGLVYRTRTLPTAEYAFWHALTQQAVYATLPRAERATAHAQVAAAIERLHAGKLDEQAVALAYHYDRSEERKKAIVYLLAAGEKLRRDYANADAIAHFRRALERIEQLPPAVAAAVLDRWRYDAALGLGRIYTTGADLEQAQHNLHIAQSLGQTLKLPPAEIVRLYGALGEVYLWRHHSDEARVLAEEGLSLVDGQPSVELAMMNHMLWCCWWSRQLNPSQGLRYLEGNVRFLHTLPYVEELRPSYWSAADHFLMRKDPAGALHWLQTFEDKANARGDLRAVGEAIFHRGIALWLQGDLATALDVLARAAEQMAHIGDRLRLVWNINATAHIQFVAGQFIATRHTLRRHAQLMMASGAPQFQAATEHLHAVLSLCDGDLERMLAEIQAIVTSAAAEPVDERPAVWLLQAELLRHAGEVDAARTAGEQALASILAVALSPPAPWSSASRPGMLLRLPLAEALSKLEAVEDPAAFRVRCQVLRSQYPDFAPEFTHWFLEPAQPDPGFGAEEVWLPHTAMTWTDPLEDCRYCVEGEEIVLYATNGRDLWQLNRSSPRLLRSVAGDFALECTLTAAHADRPAMGGLLLWQDEENYLRLHWGGRRPDEIGFDGCLGNRDLGFGRGKLPGATVVLRLERRGSA
jgi:DNA-binding SARP family transcriptional activator